MAKLGWNYERAQERAIIDLNDAQHPSRAKAIRILEDIADLLGEEDIFDDQWYEFEDMVTEIIEKPLED